MAEYQVNDRVIFRVPSDENIRRGTIVRILEDRAVGSDRHSIYAVINDNDGHTTIILDNHVEDVIAGPTFDALIADPLPNVEIGIPDDSNDLELTEEDLTPVAVVRSQAEQFAESVAIDREIRRRRAEDVLEPYLSRDRQSIRASFEEQLLRNLDRDSMHSANMVWGEPRFNTPAVPNNTTPIDEATTSNVFEMPSVYRAITIDVSQFGGNTIQEPVVPNEGRATEEADIHFRVQSEDYSPRIGRARTLRSFAIRDSDIIMSPHLEAGIYMFHSQDGTEYYNVHNAMSRIFRDHERLVIRDIHAQPWMEAEMYRHIVIRGEPIVKKPRKKLHRKHPIPEIKAEKYYEGKEFIA